MVWLNPAVLFALAAVAAPVLVHLLVQRRAERFAFPTLRFLRPTRLVSIRRHLLDDVPLLLVRCAILASAVAALAGPLIVTAARRQAWERRLVRAVVADAGDARSLAAGDRAFRTQEFSGASLRDGVRRAVAWLETAPPARRELVVASSFAIGSLAAADLTVFPPDVGIRLERTSPLPPARAVPFGRVLTLAGAVDREVTLAGSTTSVSERPANADLTAPAWPIDIIAPPAARGAADAAVDAVRARRVWAAGAERRARLVLVDRAGADAAPITASAVANVAGIHTPWMADAIARIARDADLRDAARRIPRGIVDARLAAAPWQPIARSADGEPLIAAAASAERLVVVTAAPASTIATPILVLAIANALAAIPDLQRAEVVPIRDDDLRAWSRPALPPSTTRLKNVDDDDRRWFWAAALLLMALEMWMRRARRRDASGEEREAARVA